MDASLAAKRDALERALRELARVLVAYSGGVDSAFLAATAHAVLRADALAVTAASPSLAERELRDAIELARARGWNHRVVRTDELRREEYARNSADRCYWCKVELFEVLRPTARSLGAAVCVGTNVDDLGDYRPGLRAASENDVHAPLAEAGLTKVDVRSLSAELGLPTADKPASPCLASRFAYGVRVTEEGLRRIERAEEALRALGFRVFRVRDHGDLARIEVPAHEIVAAAELRSVIAERLGTLGFRYVTLDLVGFRSGSMNEVLATPTFGAPSTRR
ncbi:MAG: ATP-dependent sacrificial sulfur transferase LarE [Actinomycetota bacterium]